MAKCKKCGADGAKTLFDEGRNKGDFCRRCVNIVSSSPIDEDGDPSYSLYQEYENKSMEYHNYITRNYRKKQGW